MQKLVIVCGQPERCCRFCLQAQTRTWTQGEYADFEKGVLKNLSVRSDGL